MQLAEAAFIEEMSRLVCHLTERISGSGDGQPRVFRDMAIENIREFFQRFRELNVHSSEQLDQLVELSQRILSGVEPQSLRDNDTVRQHVATQLSVVQSTLDGLMVDLRLEQSRHALWLRTTCRKAFADLSRTSTSKKL